MKQDLENSIVKYIFYNFGIYNKNKLSLLEFSIYDLDIFEGGKNRLYGVKAKISELDFFVFYIDTSDPIEPSQEGFLIIKTKSLPTYGLYFGEFENYIFFKTEDGGWIRTNTYLQSMFLSGMEQINDSGALYFQANSNDFNLEEFKELLKIIHE